MIPTKRDLEDAGCWFPTDKLGGPEMTAFRREARWRQHRWAVDRLQIASFGTHPGRRIHPDEPPEDIHNGTKLLDVDAEAGSNFLTPTIHQVAMDRVKAKQDHETLHSARLYRDLLSSMPMAFNLFGEASLPANQVSRQRLAELFGAAPQSPSDIIFEWSPARRDGRYTNDRTAFDVALRLGDPTGTRTVVGIETKYHEHSAKEATPSRSKTEAHERYERQTNFLIGVANRSGAFEQGWGEEVLNTDLRQIWRDHLLALSMRPNPEWTDETRYVVLYPSRNVSFADAARRYAKLLKPGDTSFRALTIDEVVDAAFAHGGATKDRFRSRYLWWVEGE